jgi:hypothetical protein
MIRLVRYPRRHSAETELLSVAAPRLYPELLAQWPDVACTLETTVPPSPLILPYLILLYCKRKFLLHLSPHPLLVEFTVYLLSSRLT